MRTPATACVADETGGVGSRVAPPSPPLGVPAYFGPWERSSWDQLLAARPAVAVINPANGPGRQRHRGYRPLVRSLQRNGATVLGYVSTSWLHAVSDALDDAQRHLDFYGVDGVLWDEIDVAPGSVAAIRSLHAWTAGAGAAAEAFNPGRGVPRTWRRLAPDAWWITFEGAGRAYLERDVIDRVGRDWHLVHSVTRRERARVDAVLRERAPALAFVTADRLPNPWDCFPGAP